MTVTCARVDGQRTFACSDLLHLVDLRELISLVSDRIRPDHARMAQPWSADAIAVRNATLARDGYEAVTRQAPKIAELSRIGIARSARMPRKPPKQPNKWSQHVTETSNAMDLEAGVFKKGAQEMARSVKRSAESSTRRKSSPFRSAMSMLTFYENRAGKSLTAADRKRVEGAKRELRKLFGKKPR
ncbi:MAG: hypothetical protein JWO36_7378 [Myxococcales bacterium]|nr:hypothetical protein [Myxococcales bacterium]